MFWSLLTFREHSTREPASSRVTDLFYSAGLHSNRCQPQLKQEKLGRGFGKNAGEWTRRVEISNEEIPGVACTNLLHALKGVSYERFCSGKTRKKVAHVLEPTHIPQAPNARVHPAG